MHEPNNAHVGTRMNMLNQQNHNSNDDDDDDEEDEVVKIPATNGSRSLSG